MVGASGTIAFIPLRHGSKSIPLKNIRLIAGRPLAAWAIAAAIDCSRIDEVVVSTDSSEIERALGGLACRKLRFHRRNTATATDEATTESAMMEYFSQVLCERIVLIQATSPLITSSDLDGGLAEYEESQFDSLLSVVRTTRFLWRRVDGGSVVPVNYRYENRPRRQDFEGQLVENGAFYITRHSEFIRSGYRLNGKIGAYEMPSASYIEVDDLNDWRVVERLLLERRHEDRVRSLPRIKLFATDIDGCLTDAGMYYSERGDELKRFNTRDGFGLRQLQESGVLVGVITTEDRELNRNRCEKLALSFDFHGVRDKAALLDRLCDRFGVLPTEVAYMGDDLNDLPLLETVGFSACPADACEEVRASVNYVSRHGGGRGAVRDVTDMIRAAVSRRTES